MEAVKGKGFAEGMRDGIPIALGYLTVSFTLGIAMKNAGMTAFQGFMMSLVNLASAGEYAGLQVILSHGSYLQMALMTLVANARYLLMGCSFSQKFSPDTPYWQRLLCGYAITDELFALAIAQKGYLNPVYYYGATFISAAGWAFGTAAGVIAGNILPAWIASGLGTALYGMFLAIIIPGAKKDKAVLAVVLAGFLCSEEEVAYVCLSALTDPAELILFHPEVISHISRFIVSAGSLKNESDTLMQRRLSLDPVAAKSFFAWDLKRVLIPGGIGEEDSAVLSYLENPESFHAENSFVQVDLNGNGRDSVNLVIDMRRGWAAELRKNLPHTDVITKRILKES